MESKYRDLIQEARELQEFFLGTYADTALEEAIKTGDDTVLSLTIKEFASHRQLMEEAEGCAV